MEKSIHDLQCLLIAWTSACCFHSVLVMVMEVWQKEAKAIEEEYTEKPGPVSLEGQKGPGETYHSARGSESSWRWHSGHRLRDRNTRPQIPVVSGACWLQVCVPLHPLPLSHFLVRFILQISEITTLKGKWLIYAHSTWSLSHSYCFGFDAAYYIIAGVCGEVEVGGYSLHGLEKERKGDTAIRNKHPNSPIKDVPQWSNFSQGPIS